MKLLKCWTCGTLDVIRAAIACAFTLYFMSKTSDELGGITQACTWTAISTVLFLDAGYRVLARIHCQADK